MHADKDLRDLLKSWRHELHRHLETGIEERRTSDFVAKLLTGMRMEIHRGITGTGLVANLRVGDGPGVIGLRADMDALAIYENAPERPHASKTVHEA